MICYTNNRQIPFEIDELDYDLVSKYTWNTSKLGYITAYNKGKTISMHRLIMGYPQGVDVDHIDGNKNNNRRSNLRICTRSQNLQNQRKHKSSTSRYKGVAFHIRSNKWDCRITVFGKVIHLGSYATETEAALAYNTAAMRYFGEFACLNIIS